MTKPQPSIKVNVDVTNPGQFFACCGLLELADRLWPGAEGWFEEGVFCISGSGVQLPALLEASQSCIAFGDDNITDDDESDDDDEAAIVAPILLDPPFCLRLDWWAEKSLKTWAGSMKVEVIALAMSRAIDPKLQDPFTHTQIVYTPQSPRDGSRNRKLKKREPFYFDSRRGPNSHSRDVGFSVDKVKTMKTHCSPVTEFMCLVGLQRFRPRPLLQPRHFSYCTWTIPCDVQIAPAYCAGLISELGATQYRFINAFRTGQKKHKAFLPAVPLQETR